VNRAGAWWWASFGAVLVYTSAVLVAVPPPLFFFPRLWRWGLHPLPDEPAIRWYGSLLYLATGGLCGFVVGRLLHRRPPWVLVALISATALLVLWWHERHWFSP